MVECGDHDTIWKHRPERRAPSITWEEAYIIRITDLAESGDPFIGGLLIEAAGLRVLVDPGQGPDGVDTLPPTLATGEPLAAIIITHAHADHSAGLPAVLAAYPTAHVLATPSTIALLQLLGRLPEEAKSRVQAVPFYERCSLVQPWTIRLLPAGHLLGAAMVVFDTPEGCVVCSGDVSLVNQHTVRRAARPRQRADVLVLESTYGDREFRPRIFEEARLVEQVHAAFERDGHTLITAPLLGTAQEILLTLLNARLLGQLAGVIWVDEALQRINNLYSQYASPEYPQLARWIATHGNPFRPDELVLTAHVQDQWEILKGPPAIIITPWNYFRSGSSRFYARALASAEPHLILAPAGRPTQQYLAQAVTPQIVHCALGSYGLMSHADGAALAALAGRWHPGLVAINHGQPHAKEALQARLANSGIEAICAVAGQSILWPATAR